ncbi:MAG: hypothetical protein ACOC97_02715 [Myxococcota bacterium]
MARSARWLLGLVCSSALVSGCGEDGDDFGIDDPSDDFDIFDPQEGAEGMELPEGTETAWPPSEDVAAFLGALEAGGGTTYLHYHRERWGELFNVRVRIDPDWIVANADGSSHADVDLGSVSVRVSSTADSTTPLPVLVVPATDLTSVVLLKSYSRARNASGVLGRPRLDMVSAFQQADETRGPLASLDLSADPSVDASGDCDAMAWEMAGEIAPIAVAFPPVANCSLEECAIVKSAWIRATHDLFRIRQMVQFMDTKHQEQRAFLWSQRAVDEQGDRMGEETSLAFYFGGFAQYRFEAIRWAINRLWSDMHDHDLEALPLDIECNPGGVGDVCNTTNPPAHHSVKSNLKICPSFWDQGDWYLPLLMVHEPLHHLSVPWNNGTPRLDPIMDTHTHGHGNSCLGSIQTNKAYGINRVRHLATYQASNGGHCFHRNFAFRNNDSYGWAALQIGGGVRNGQIRSWPHRASSSPSPQFQPCDGSQNPIPPPGDDWSDPLDDCQKIGQELVCPGAGGGGAGGASVASQDLALDCPTLP